MSLSNGYDLPSLAEWQQSIRTIEQVSQQRDELLAALEILRPRVMDEYDRLYISGVIAKVKQS